MSCCCCLPFCRKNNKPNTENDFKEIDKILVDHALHWREYTPPRCTKVAYEVQWGHIHTTSQVVEFNLRPHNKGTNALSRDLDKVTNSDDSSRNARINNKPEADDKTETSKSSHVTSSQLQLHTDGKDNKLIDPEGEHDGVNDTATTSFVNGDTASSTNQSDCTIKTGNQDSHSLIETINSEEKTTPGTIEQNDDDHISMLHVDGKHVKRQKVNHRSRLRALLRIGIFSTQLSTQDKGEPKASAKINIPVIKEQTEPTSPTYFDDIKAEIFSNSMCLFRTEYINTSDDDQSFTFQTDKRTSSSVAVNIQQSYKIGGKVSLGLKLPVVSAPKITPLHVTGELTGEMQWTNSKTTTSQQEMNWSVNNVVKVGKNQKVTAELKVVEEEATAFFKVKHTITPISGYSDDNDAIPIYIIPKADLKKEPEKRKILSTRSIKKVGKFGFCDAFNDYNEKQLRSGLPAEFIVNEKNNSVDFFVEGVVKCVYQAKQVINVTKEELSNNNEEQLGAKSIMFHV